MDIFKEMIRPTEPAFVVYSYLVRTGLHSYRFCRAEGGNWITSAMTPRLRANRAENTNQTFNRSPRHQPGLNGGTPPS